MSRLPSPRRPLAILLAVSVTLLGLEGCTSFSVEERKPEKGALPRAASLRVSVYADRAAMKKAEVFGGAVRSKLVRLQPEPEETVFESAEASWLFTELPPGRYRLEISQRAGPEPDAAQVWRGSEKFTVKTNEEVGAVVVLKDSRGWAWAGTGVGIAVLAVLGVLVLVGIVSLGTKGVTLSRSPVDDQREAAVQRPSTPSQPRVP